MVGDATVDAQPGGVVAADGKIGVISVLAYTIELFDPRTLKRGRGRATPASARPTPWQTPPGASTSPTPAATR